MTVRVGGHDADDPAVVRVDPLGRQLLELGDHPLMGGVELADHVGGRATARPLHDVGVERVRIVDSGIGLRTCLAHPLEAHRDVVFPGGRVRDEVLVGPAARGRVFERGQSDRADGQSEGDPVRLDQPEEIVFRADRRVDVGEVVGVVARRVPFDDVEHELVGVLGERTDRLEHSLVRGGPAREELIRRLALRLCCGARVERVDVVVELRVLSALEHRGDALRHGLLPRRKVRDVLVEGPPCAELLRKSVARERLERRSQRAVALADLAAQRVFRSSRDRGTHRRPPSAQVPARRRWRLPWRTRQSGA